MNQELIVAILSSVASMVVAIASIYANNRVLGFKVDELRKDVEKHNQIVERVYVLERDLKTAFFRIDEHKEELRALRSK